MMRLLALSLCVVACTSNAARAQTPDIRIEQHINAQVPLDLAFRDEHGRTIALGDCVKDKPVILVLAYSRCPRLCSLVLNGLTESVRKLDFRVGVDFTMVTVSIDPHETPELAAAKKAAYVEHLGQPGADAGWHFLTGDEHAIGQLADAVGFGFKYDPASDQFAHASGIIVLTPDGKVSRYLYGVEFAPRDLQFALEDASAGKIGSPVARPLRLLCFAYDPAEGKYSLAVVRIMQAAGAFTLLVVGAMLIRAWRRERVAKR